MKWLLSLSLWVATPFAALLSGTTPARAQAGDPSLWEADLEKATRCLRRADTACAEKHAVAANAPEAPIAIRREALHVLVTAAGQADGQAALELTRTRCEALLTLWPNFEPPPDARPTVVQGCSEARKKLLEARLPTLMDPGPPPLPNPETAFLPPAIYHPAHLADLPPEKRRFSFSLAAGVALPLGRSSDRFEAGIQALIDLRFELSGSWALSLQGGLALLRLNADLPVEPHQGTSLTVFSATAGLEHRSPLADSLELVLALGLGAGGFGLQSPDEAMGLAISPNVGVRYLAAESLSVRADVAPTLILPFSDLATGGHLSFVVRGEARF